MGNSSTLVMIALMVIAFYLLILRPQKKRQLEMQRTLRSLEPGDRVLLGSGLFGTIISLGERQAVLEISPGVELTVLKQAIVRRASEADEDPVEDVLDDDLADDELAAGSSSATSQDLGPATGTGPTGSTSLDTPTQDRGTPSAGADPNRLG